jgi:DNA-binding NarL/FixJ family response regulator
MASRLLIVDDNETVRHGLRKVLQSNPELEICGEASDGLTAVELFRELRPNVVILDFQLPGIDGLEAARRMSEISPSVPIVMFTQHASPDLKKHAQKVGIRSVVSKTEAFPMIKIIETLLGSSDSDTSTE